MGIQQALLGGTYGDKITLNSETVTALTSSPTTAEAGYRLSASRAITIIVNGTPSSLINWIEIAANVGLYEARATLNVGTFSSGSGVGTWLNLATDRTWFRNKIGIGTASCEFLIEIREASSGVVKASAVINLEAEVI